MRLACLASLLLCAVPSPASEFGREYFFVLVKEQPYANAWGRLLTDAQLGAADRYLLKGDYVTDPMKAVVLDGVTYQEALLCKPKACRENRVIVLVDPAREELWAVHWIGCDGRPAATRYYGRPSAEMRHRLAARLTASGAPCPTPRAATLILEPSHAQPR